MVGRSVRVRSTSKCSKSHGVLLGAADLTSADTTGPTWEVRGAPNFRDDPAELRPEGVVSGEGIRTFEAFAMDLQTTGTKPVTSGNADPADNFRAYSPQTADDHRLQPDTPGSTSRYAARHDVTRPPPSHRPDRRLQLSGGRSPLRYPANSTDATRSVPCGPDLDAVMASVRQFLGAG